MPKVYLTQRACELGSFLTPGEKTVITLKENGINNKNYLEAPFALSLIYPKGNNSISRHTNDI